MKPQKLKVNYKTLMKGTTVSDRVELTKSDAGRQLMQSLTPSEVAAAFPDYYKRTDPDVRGFMQATSRKYGGTQSVPGSDTIQGTASRLSQTSPDGVSPVVPGRGTPPAASRQETYKDPILARLEKVTNKQMALPANVDSTIEGKPLRQAIVDYVKKNVPDATDAGIAALLSTQKHESGPQGVYNIGDYGKSFMLFQMNNFGSKHNQKSRLDALLEVAREKTGLQDPLQYIRDVRAGKIKPDPKITAGLTEASLEHIIFRDVDKKINNDRIMRGLRESDPTRAIDLVTSAIRPQAYLNAGIRGIPDRVRSTIEEMKAGIKATETSPGTTSSELPALPKGISPEIQQWFDKLPQHQQAYVAKELNTAIQSENIGGDITKFNEAYTKSKDAIAHANVTASTLTGTDPGSVLTNRVEERQQTVANKRKLPLKPELKEALNYAAYKTLRETGANIVVDVTSGGQHKTGPRTGTHRHDTDTPGTPGAADADLYKETIVDGKKVRTILNPNKPEDRPYIAAFTKNFSSAIPSAGVGAQYMRSQTKIHFGGPETPGRPATAYAGDQWFRDSHKEGVQIRQEAVKNGVDVLADYRKEIEEEKKKQTQAAPGQVSPVVPPGVPNGDPALMKNRAAAMQQSTTAQPTAQQTAPNSSALKEQTKETKTEAAPVKADGGEIATSNPEDIRAVPITQSLERGQENTALIDVRKAEPLAAISDQEKVTSRDGNLDVVPKKRVEPDTLRDRTVSENMKNAESQLEKQQENISRVVQGQMIKPDDSYKAGLINGTAGIYGDALINDSMARAFKRTLSFSEDGHFNQGAANFNT